MATDHKHTPSTSPALKAFAALLCIAAAGAMVSAALMICVPSLATAYKNSQQPKPSATALAATPQLPGAKVFNEKGCVACHNLSEIRKVGPGLKGVTDKQSKEWIEHWLKNPKGLADSGDAEAVRVFKEFAPNVMPPQRLSEQEFNDLYDFLKGVSAGTVGAAAASYAEPAAAPVKDLPNPYTFRLLDSNQGYMPVQPIAFSHEWHAGQKKIACLYCHFGAEKSKHAGIPPLNVCMNCHRVLRKNNSPEIAKIVKAYESNTPIQWVKVHNLPDHVDFNHSVHVNKGINCTACHGEVTQMVHMRQVKKWVMGDCIKCHRAMYEADPVRNKKPNDGVNCSACHH